MLNTLGDGFVEAVDDQTLIDIAAKQPSLSNGKITGETVEVPILEAPGQRALAALDGRISMEVSYRFPRTHILTKSGLPTG